MGDVASVSLPARGDVLSPRAGTIVPRGLRGRQRLAGNPRTARATTARGRPAGNEGARAAHRLGRRPGCHSCTLTQGFSFRAVPSGIGDTYQSDRIPIRGPLATEGYSRNQSLPAQKQGDASSPGTGQGDASSDTGKGERGMDFGKKREYPKVEL
ncbi:hypothetical protein BHE74_00049746 [Ensete ventricosum]|nr:hypothetical protein BHE74_00049746 [Ensete ventricosum]